MATAAPPPAPPPAGVTIIDTPEPNPPPAPTSTILVSQMPKSATAPAAPAKGSAMDRLKADLAKKAKPAAEEPPPTPTATPAKATDLPDQSGATETPPGGETPPSPGETPPAGTETPPGKPAKTNPWKLIEQYKGKLAALEKEVAEVKTGALGETQRKAYLDQIETMTKRVQDLENEIRFVNYSKHPEFVKKYEEPYQAAWKRATAELGEITVVDAKTQQPRPADSDDLIALCNLPLGKARELAETFFGNFADDVMQHRKEIRALFDARNAALEEARTQGAERDKQAHEIAQKHQQQAAEMIQKVWDEANQAILNDEKYGSFFRPVEGDQDGNQRLAKGFELVDKAFTENPMDPRLTPEQRATAVKRHVALRNRAAAFGRLVSMVQKLQAQNAELAKELKEFKNSEPPAGGSAAPPGEPVTSAREAVFAALRARAK